MYNILSRLAINRGLTVVTYNNRPMRIEERDTHPIIKNIIPNFAIRKSKMFNLLIDHSYFVKEDVEAILKPPISYIAMLRDPLSQFRSEYFFSGKGKKTLFSDPGTRHKEYIKSVKSRGNRIAALFGAQTTMMINDESFQQFLNDVDRTFLVGITEHYTESLILFKRRLCWQLQDVIHVHIRRSKYHSQVTIDQKQDEKLRQTLCYHNAVDCELYDHFNRSFWRQIQLEGDNFQLEVEQFRSIIKNVSEFCSSNFMCIRNNGVRKWGDLYIEKSQWNRELWFTVDDCAGMSLTEQAIANYHYYTQNINVCYKLNKSKSKACAVKPWSNGPKTCDGLCAHAPNTTRMLDGLLNTEGTCL